MDQTLASVSLIEEQEDLEAMMQGMTLTKFNDHLARQRKHGQEKNTPYGIRMIKRAVAPLKKAIEGFMVEAESVRHAGRRFGAVRYMKLVEPDVLAYITSKVVLDQITVGQRLQSAALAVALQIEDEVRFRKFDEEHPNLWFLTMRDAKEDERKKRARLVRSYNMYVEQWKHWPQADKLHLGMKLIELFCETTGYAHVDTRYDGRNKTSLILVATPKVLSWIEGSRESAAMISPVYLPMVVPPTPWEGPHGGGYMTTAVKPLSFVKTNNKNYLKELENMSEELEDVYNAVNVLQNVRWQVNPHTYEAMRSLWERGIAAAKIPPREPAPLPPLPFESGRDKSTLTDEEKRAFHLWKRKASKIHDYNQKLKTRRMQIAKVIAIAEQFVKYDAIYMPYTLDFRGRAYAVPMFLNPQGSDHAKGLLRFAEGKPLGSERAAGWLAIHGANCWGFDKVSLEDRISWVEERSDWIEGIGNDPLGDLSWTEADSAFQFLAFCVEWAGYCRDGIHHVSHLPIALDGSCSGLQHFSAVLRDPVGGSAVNLVPHDTPSDVYQQVIDRAVDNLRSDLATSDTIDKDLAYACFEFGVNRKTAKRATMTVPYGSTRYSCRDFVAEYIAETTEERKEIDPGYVSPLVDREFDASLLLAGYVWDAIGETVVAARTAMDWLRETARLLAQEELPVTWTTPDGFPVIQSYANVKHRRVKTKFGDQLVYLSLAEDENDKLDSRRQANGVAPNWVHSMDGCHLRQTVNLGYANGLENFACVHDSFGVHASDTDLLGVCLRETFVDLYQGNPLRDFRDEVCPILSTSDEIPALPPVGSLDLEAVKSSDFVFA